jgi:hypothetical protein
MQISFEEVSLNKRTKKQASITNWNRKRLKPGIAKFNNLFAQKRKSVVTTIIGSGVVISEGRQYRAAEYPAVKEVDLGLTCC